MSARLNLLSPDVRANPYPFFAELRRTAPVSQIEPAGMWAVSRYDDALTVLKNPQLFFSSGMAALMTPPWLERGNPSVNSILFKDPPQHGRLRALVSRAFNTTALNRLEPRIRDFAASLVKALPTQTEVDFVTTFALPLPARVIGELLGLEPSLHSRFKRWSNDLVSVSAVPPDDLAMQTRVRQSLEEMEHHMKKVLEDRRRQPREDMVSELLRAQVDGERLTEEELVGFLVLLLSGGLETTMHLLAQAARVFIGEPQVLARLRAEPSLIPAFIEEVLRYEPPIHLTIRQTTQEVELGGARIPRGALVAVLLGSVNHDEAQFPHGDRFDMDRPGPQNLPFGHGIHFCLGAQLARLEARLGLEALLARFGSVERGNAPEEWSPAMMVRGLNSLPVRLREASGGQRTS
ncbi:cytochrome P450 [Archangium sp.]|uniref:cytochrome P450 n=1 Tax=Archangium sp. TaxID=1872627 RepID=UPI00286B0FE0|nr:cytochrome P450 [Archangium sp.]